MMSAAGAAAPPVALPELPGLPANLNFDAPDAPELSDADLSFLLRWRALSAAAAATSPSDATAAAAEDAAALRQHVLAVWRDIKATAHVYRCVQALSFLTPRAPRHPGWGALLSSHAAAAAASAPFLVADVGCAFGQDTRALIAAGVPPACCVASDVHDAYWRAGLRLFGDDDSTARASGLLAAVRPAFGDWAAPLDAADDVAAGLEGALDGALLMFVLHVLSREQCDRLLARLARCAKPGGVLLGAAVGAATAGEWALTPDGAAPRWLHSEASLAEALAAAGWDGAVSVVAAPPGEWEEGPAPPAAHPHMAHVLRLQFSAAKRSGGC
jgi:SAM-dependent methyltransferase